VMDAVAEKLMMRVVPSSWFRHAVGNLGTGNGNHGDYGLVEGRR